jgi:hypothetical protein
MGRSYKVKYTVTIKDNSNAYTTPMAWHSKDSGKPNEANLQAWIYKYIDSLKCNGCNYHISKALGYMPIPNNAFITNQFTGKIMATWKAPAFMII